MAWVIFFLAVQWSISITLPALTARGGSFSNSFWKNWNVWRAIYKFEKIMALNIP